MCESLIVFSSLLFAGGLRAEVVGIVLASIYLSTIPMLFFCAFICLTALPVRPQRTAPLFSFLTALKAREIEGTQGKSIEINVVDMILLSLVRGSAERCFSDRLSKREPRVASVLL